MTQGPSEDELRRRAADPATSQRELYLLAADHPEVRPLIAENPNTYQGLLDWLAKQGDPRVDAALARRHGTGDTDEPTAFIPPQPPPGDNPTRPLSAAQREQEFGAVRQGQDSSDFFDRVYSAGPHQPTPQQPADEGYYPAPPPVAEYPQQQWVQTEPERSERRGGGAAGFCVILLMLVLLLAAGLAAVYFLLLGGGDDEPEPAPVPEEVEEPQDEAEEDQQPEDSPEPSPEDEEEDGEARPAPDDARQIGGFSTPTGNIHCQFGGGTVSCTIEDYDFDGPDGCDDPVTLHVDASGATEMTCGAEVSQQGTVLDYDEAATEGDFACVSQFTGTECWSTEHGDGFHISRGEYDLYSWD
ncbi:hypothetical protein [Nesterenkonia alba]|uniref:variant leucine-rich repeat-containing protein n=1 Tax=Nesterenkonia alba TaxID=515814 RepID=UPI0003B6E589|nr:hypothetical protein [Nesterenkonia alba]